MLESDLNDFFKSVFNFWDILADNEKNGIIENTMTLQLKAGATIFHYAGDGSRGIHIIRKGRARVYINSPEDRELTLFYVMENEIFVLGLSCVLDEISFDVNLQMETDCEVVFISRGASKRLYDNNAAVKNIVAHLIAARLSLALKLLGKVAFSSVVSRIAFLLTELRQTTGAETIKITHIEIATQIGTAREVVTRLLNELQDDGVLKLSRGKVAITDLPGLLKIRDTR